MFITAKKPYKTQLAATYCNIGRSLTPGAAVAVAHRRQTGATTLLLQLCAHIAALNTPSDTTGDKPTILYVTSAVPVSIIEDRFVQCAAQVTVRGEGQYREKLCAALASLRQHNRPANQGNSSALDFDTGYHVKLRSYRNSTGSEDGRLSHLSVDMIELLAETQRLDIRVLALDLSTPLFERDEEYSELIAYTKAKGILLIATYEFTESDDFERWVREESARETLRYDDSVFLFSGHPYSEAGAIELVRGDLALGTSRASISVMTEEITGLMK